jgi:hypothetical protein
MINLKNYEEWFLLYADNELSTSEKESVMAFIDLHPDLRQEMDLLLTLKCIPDHRINFREKEMLYIPEEQDEAPITFSPDLTIVFPDKSTLYRKVPVQKMNWLRPLSVAASLIFMVGLMWRLMQLSGDQEMGNTGIHEQGVSALVNIPDKKTSPVSGFAPQIRQVNAATTKVKSVANNFVLKSQQSVLQSDANMEVVTVYHSPEPAVELFSETPAITAQTNFSPAALEAARARLITNPVGNPSTVSIDLTEGVPVNTALLIEDAIKQEDQSIFRGIIRRINRVIQDDKEEPERKFIQVANFQIPVKQ